MDALKDEDDRDESFNARMRYFRVYLRVSPEEFNELKAILRPLIKRYPAGRKALSVGERLAITLRYV